MPKKINSREKGKHGEREWASICRSYGYSDARRGQQFCGLEGDADVVGVPGLHSEVKRVERLNIYDAMAQSTRGAKDGEIPIVAHRRNNCKWLVTMKADDFFKIYREYHSGIMLKEKEG